MKLPQQLSLPSMQNTWATAIEPVLNCPLVQGHMLNDVSLSVGSNPINHKLGRKLLGWYIVGINAAASIYDTQATNQNPQLTLNLVSSAATQVTLWVF